MTNTPHVVHVDLQEAAARNHTARDVLAELSTAIPPLSGIWRLLDAALADTPALTAEILRLAALHLAERRAYADLLAAARATLAADRDGEPDPLYYLRDELTASGQGPAPGGRP
ncbi:MAG TPA: hypothetical protein VFU43_03470 [Streptosporangiaceae bacterium]|nr:hypothetical protein [Streptosporangiaceae bacterium]